MDWEIGQMWLKPCEAMHLSERLRNDVWNAILMIFWEDMVILSLDIPLSMMMRLLMLPRNKQTAKKKTKLGRPNVGMRS
jgi:hypothetical protein